jgi:cytochrome c oxidase assembly factor CtaG
MAKDVAVLERKKTVQVQTSSKMYNTDLFFSPFFRWEEPIQIFPLPQKISCLLDLFILQCIWCISFLISVVALFHIYIRMFRTQLKEHLAKLTDEQQLLPYPMILFERAPQIMCIFWTRNQFIFSVHCCCSSLGQNHP